MKILLATNNKHKIEEIQDIANKMLSHAVQFLSSAELNIHCQPEENGATLLENSTIKAIAFYDEMRKLNIEPIKVVADDSGLEIDALNGLPGVHSARFAYLQNENSMPIVANIDKANREKVLLLLKNQVNRKAKFSTALTLYDGKQAKHYIGQCHGKIISEERGDNGFGYDSIFIPEGFNKTFAEMNENEKNKISHRQIAVMKLLQDQANLSV